MMKFKIINNQKLYSDFKYSYCALQYESKIPDKLKFFFSVIVGKSSFI